MKKLIAILMAVGTTSFATHAFAQGTSSMSSTVGSKRISTFSIMPAITFGGTQFTSLSQFGNQAKAQTGLSYSVGALGEVGRGTFVFQTGLLYMQQSASANVDRTYSEGSSLNHVTNKTEISASYLGVPLALKARTRVAQGVRLVGRIGVMPALFLSQKTKVSGTVSSNGVSEEDTNSTDTSALRGFNVFGIMGAGPEFAVSKGQNLRVELGYERMLLSAAEKSESNTNSDWGFHSLNLMLSYAVAL